MPASKTLPAAISYTRIMPCPNIPEYSFSTSRIIPALYLHYTWATFVDSGPRVSLGASRTKYSVSPAPRIMFFKTARPLFKNEASYAPSILAYLLRDFFPRINPAL